ncbi:hypothetical protein M0R45_037006 [Rubus argutus]|uniref:Uncharacterized protein n=1 Tax=Rubus argutus TaxID=59490 RepID=A0AAW1W177_RUBAR
MCAMASVSENFNSPSPTSEVQVLNINWFQKQPNGNGEVCIRWVCQVGTTLAVKSYNKESLKQNAHVFDWELSQEGLDKISQIPQGKMMPSEEWVLANAPYIFRFFVFLRPLGLAFCEYIYIHIY